MTLPVPLKACETRGGASCWAIHHVEEKLGRELPLDYKNLLLESDGLDGFVSEENYISLWSTSDLALLNDKFCVSEFVPGITLLGTDGGDTGYGFREVNGLQQYVTVPLVGMQPDAVLVKGWTFLELLESLIISR